MAILSLSVALLDGTAMALLVGLGDEGKPRPFYRWLFSTLENGEKRQEKATSYSIGGSLRRSIPETVAAEANRKRHHTDSSSSQATCSKRPPGVKAAKMSAKEPVIDENTMNEFQKMWTIKQQDLAAKERLSKMSLLDSLI
ncbi:hypothetical protein F2Q69_00024642 [Brassica cretica]|uniref:No apical meristem-associated C-terminal domain-containing protein n=1 Tax=Brassica cretica TaxID=69181 RepID=A0A8S9QN02_BRACR|nr:hypothetical protein F2Q69_00024642 [Brassica cretica]